jgi:hypothetical protein
VKPDPELLFEAVTPLGFTVRVTRERWNLITTIKHPVLITAYPADTIKEGMQIWPK